MHIDALEKRIVRDGDGHPVEVVIPYGKFVEFLEANGLDLREEEKAELREAEADYKAGKRDAFVDFEEVRREFGCAE